MFTGRRLDTLDGGSLKIYYYRARYYDPYTGRFLQRDPLGYIGGMSLYQYVGSKPTIGFDPYGFFDPYVEIPPLQRKCQRIMLKWGAKVANIGRKQLTCLRDVYPKFESNPFQHCVWNCRMTLRKGRKFAEDCSDNKEDLDNAFANWGNELKEAGCWDMVSKDFQDTCGWSAMSDHQDSDSRDNEAGRECAEDPDVIKCSGGRYINMSTASTFADRTDYCADCCQNTKCIDINEPEGPGTNKPHSKEGPDDSEDCWTKIFEEYNIKQETDPEKNVVPSHGEPPIKYH